MERIKKNNKGITLLVLVITIIVMLILAAVVVSLALGDGGVLGEARLAANEWDKAGEGEQSELSRLAKAMRDARNGVNTGGSSGGNQGGNGNTNETGGNEGEGSGNVKPGQEFTEKTEVTVDGKKVTVPGGATVSGVEGETTIDEGLVIYMVPKGETVDWSNEAEVEYAQKTYSQFVWIPVEMPVLDLSEKTDSLASDETVKAAVELQIARGHYPMAVKNADGNYFGVLYQFAYDGEKDLVVPAVFTNWSPLGDNYKEPGIVVGGYKYKEGDQGTNLQYMDGILNRGYSTDMLGTLQQDFNDMVTGVLENGGFWIGRYETSGMSTTTTNTYTMDNEIRVNSVKEATTGISCDWYRSYGQHGVYAKKAEIDFKSNMIWGSQFDQAIIWLKDVRNPSQGEHVYYVINSTGMKGTSSSKTGQVKVKNIYDLSGGIGEALPTVGRVEVSGNNSYRCYRFQYQSLPTKSNWSTDSMSGYRLALY